MGRSAPVHALCLALVTGDLAQGQPSGHASPAEPDARVAARWWPPHWNVWTPIGWKDHLFRFSVRSNGGLHARPHTHKSKNHTRPYAGLGVDLSFLPSSCAEPPVGGTRREPALWSDLQYEPRTPDAGLGHQGWVDGHATPVLWTEWPLVHGLVLRQEVFAHVPNGGDVETGIEPLYAWIRLSVPHVDELDAVEHIHVLIRFNEDSKIMLPARPYPRRLTAETWDRDGKAGLHVYEPDGRIRLAALPSTSATFAMLTGKEKDSNQYLRVTLQVRVGAFADLLVPMIAGPRVEIETEAAVGYDRALAEADTYWARKPPTAAIVDTPEPELNAAIAHSVKFAEIITEKNPETGEYAFLSGAANYEVLWATPASMLGQMLLDNLGYHDVVDRHIEIFRTHQGEIKPPGPAYSMHPGYLATPGTLTSFNWLADHGAILYMAANHALVTNDAEFIERWLDPIIKACEFTRDARAIRDHNGFTGVLPPAVATDRNVPHQSVWNAGWHYKGLTTAVRLLRKLDHPRAQEFADEARSYKARFAEAFRARAATMPAWHDASGNPHPLVPVSFTDKGDESHPFYLDAGPLFLVWSGLVSADDPLMRSTVTFFREGPNTRLFDTRGRLWQRPILIHEISSWEPCYSWNVYHSWQLGDRYRYLEGMYSLLAGALSTQTYISCEIRHEVYGTVFASPLLVDLVRLAVIDDALIEGEVHLLRLAPKAWLRTDYLTRFERMPSIFGPVTQRFQLEDEGRTLSLTYQPRFWNVPARVVLHVPPVPGLERVIINGRSRAAKPGAVLDID